MTTFKDSQEQAFRRLVRAAIRKGDFTKGERDVTLALVNHWFHHKAKGKMHPGLAKIARQAKVTEKTVSRTFGKLRDAGIMIALTPLKGNRYKATEYVLDLVALMVFCGCGWADDLLKNVPSSVVKMSHLSRDKMSHRINTVATAPSQLRVVVGRDA